MKKIILILAVLFSSFTFSQEVWEDLPLNPNCTNTVYDIEMINGKVYQIYNQFDGSNYFMYVDFFNTENATWENKTSLISTQSTRLRSEKIGTTIYIASYDNANFSFYELLESSSVMTSLTANYAFSAVNSNWEFHAGKNPEELYVLFTTGTGPSDVHGLEYDVQEPGSWGYVTESSGQNLALADLQIQSTETDVYFGVYSNVVRVTRFAKGNIGVIFAYDGLAGNVQSEGVNWDNSGFALIGNRNDYVAFYGTEDANNTSHEAEVEIGTTINVDIDAASTGFNLDANYLAKESSPSHAFIYSQFSVDGLGNPNDNLKVIRRDIASAGTWQAVGGNSILPPGTFLEQNSLNLTLDNGFHHLAAAYILQGNPSPEIKVSNQVPFELTGTLVPNSGLCANQMNELYSNIEIQDFDFDRITITNISSLNSQTTGLVCIPNGFFNGVSKFKIIGIPISSSDQIVIDYTDGYGTFSLTLDTYISTTNPANVQFVSDPVVFCSNDHQVDLSQYVSYYDQGSFRLNGLDLDNSVINANFLNENLLSSGTLRYIVNINGCFITTTANYNIVAPPTIDILTTASNCTLSNGDATATINNGASSNVNFYWSTGQTSTTISNLTPGAYYAFAFDDNNCKAIALASVEAGDITLTETITNPSCYGANDGSISIAVTGSTNYDFIWTTGGTSTTLSNTPAGHYECTLYDESGCEVKKSYELVNPIEIKNNFIVNKPDCATANGSILTSVTGGTGTYTYIWNTSASTPNLNNISQGLYTVVIFDANFCTISDSVMLNDNHAMIITDSLILASCNIDNGGIDVTLTQHPLGGPVNSIVWSNGLTTEDLYNLQAGSYLISVNSGANCIAQKFFNLGARPPLRNDICVVTVDTATTTNLVVWEKGELEGISHYNIYRENDECGSYMLIDTVQYNSLSVFNDVVASPLHRSWRYQISAVNTCGVEGPLSIIHKTLHLNTIVQGSPGIIDVYWDDYEGLNSGSYVVYRHTDLEGWTPVSPAIPFGSATQYTDTPPLGFTGLDYFVDFELATPCTATYRAQDFNRSRSNREKGSFSPGTGVDDSSNIVITIDQGFSYLTVSPNPFQDEINFNLAGENNAEIDLFDINGKLLITLKCNEGNTVLDTKNLNSGIYFVKAKIKNQVHTLKIVK
ncbi:MAG: T9SS type A sorting domain-containing protein [Bacteroidota bacterium]